MMSLDFHIGQSPSEASSSVPSLRMELGAHKLVFNDHLRGRYPQLARIRYFEDEIFSNVELRELEAEANQAASELWLNTESSKFLMSLTNICRNARLSGLQLYVFCD